jgi:hypothetical protein
MEREFPTQEACAIQAYAQARVMDASDPSHVCKRVMQTLGGSCTVPHGLLGGHQGNGPVTRTELHAEAGVPLPSSAAASKPHGWLSDMSRDGNLWAGALPMDDAFLLAMPRDRLHPAHVAFGLDTSLTTLPLKVQGLGLLFGSPSSVGGRQPSAAWVQTLPLRVRAELQTARILELYPQLQQRTGAAAAAATAAAVDWSCPIRKLVFWGSKTEGFGPITPNPVVAALLYPNLTGVHPLIEPEGPYARRADYVTPNGVCYYRKDASTRPVLDVASNVESQCSLLGMLKRLASAAGGTEVPLTIQEPFQGRCNDIIDAPDAGGRLRSGETLPPALDLRAECGLLHRLRPALIRVKGDAVPVRASSTAGLTTASEGGDCHMGRATVVAQDALQGKQCATVEKTRVQVQTSCKDEYAVLPRARPLRLAEVLAKERSTVVYRSDFRGWPQFIGPAGVQLGEPEHSFGQLYSATLKETLSADLLLAAGATPTPAAAWTGPTFWERYDVQRNQSQQLQQPLLLPVMMMQPLASSKEESSGLKEALAEDFGLWAQTDWAWSFLTKQKSQGGGGKDNVSQALWAKNRSQACNASMEAYLGSVEGAADLVEQQGVRRIALCAPAPTGDLATLCTQMTQFSIDVAQANCQLVGRGDCIANLGMFYLPYMWSSTNQVSIPLVT